MALATLVAMVGAPNFEEASPQRKRNPTQYQSHAHQTFVRVAQITRTDVQAQGGIMTLLIPIARAMLDPDLNKEVSVDE